MKDPARIPVLVCLIAFATSCGSGDDGAVDAPAETNAQADSPAADEPAVDEPDEPAVDEPDEPAVDEPDEPAVDEPDEPAVDGPPVVGSVCDLATDEEISAIVANEVLGVDIDTTLCEYSLVSGAPAVDGTTVDVFTNAAFDDVCSLEFDLVGAGDAQPVDGLGNTAFWDGGTQTPQLFICTGTSFVSITQYKPPTVTDEQALVRAQEVADIVLSRL
jgi:hypothetical protein